VQHICGAIHETLPGNLLTSKTSCPECERNTYKGEQKIKEYLDTLMINYIHDKENEYFGRLRPDFYLADKNIIIEYHGIQHYEPVEFFGGVDGFNERIIRDKQKEDIAKDLNFNFVVIPYWDFDNIEQILNEMFNDYSERKYT
jgi:very-short-patch-repair endonuclease